MGSTDNYVGYRFLAIATKIRILLTLTIELLPLWYISFDICKQCTQTVKDLDKLICYYVYDIG